MPAFKKLGSFFKADLEIVFKNMQRKHECTSLEIYSFFEAIEILSQKLYKGEDLGSKVRMFLADTLPYFRDKK